MLPSCFCLTTEHRDSYRLFLPCVYHLLVLFCMSTGTAATALLGPSGSLPIANPAPVFTPAPMSTTTVSSDMLPANVPKLELDGSNWAIWAMRFEIAVKAKKKWPHFVGGTRPTTSTIVTADEQLAIDKWDKDEAMSMYLLTQ
jgi:hypothetical protein